MTAVVEDIDALRALQLRYRFSDSQFLGLVWRSLQNAGWTYRDSRYYAPSAVNNGKSKIPPLESNELKELLDQDALPLLYGNLQSFSSEVQRTQPEYDPLDKDHRLVVQKLRHDVLYQMQLLLEKSKRPKSNQINEIDDKVTSDLPSKEPTPTAAENSIMNIDAQNSLMISEHQAKKTSKITSFTSLEKGSDLYLHKNAKKSLRPTNPSRKDNFNTTIDYEDVGQNSIPTISECANLIQQYTLAEVESLEKEYANQFEEWRFLLSTHHCILLYGAGSKYNLLENFAKTELDKEGYALVLNGFDPLITIHGILDLLVQIFFEGVEPKKIGKSLTTKRDLLVDASNPFQCLPGDLFNPHTALNPIVARAIAISEGIAEIASVTYIPLFIVIHNIDGLRNRIAQQALSALFRNSTVANGVPSIRIVASVDHIDASAVLWDSETLWNFKWMWKEVHTHRPYVHELAMLSDTDIFTKTQSKKTQEKKRRTGQSVRYLDVVSSLPPRTCEVTRILAGMQLEEIRKNQQSDESNVRKSDVSKDKGIWIDFQLFRSTCKRKFIVNTDEELRKLLQELTDHRLVQRKTERSSEFVTIPFDIDKLNEIIAYKN